MKKSLVISIMIFVLLSGINIFLDYSISNYKLTGAGITATVGFVILEPNETIYIDSPQNTTYNFSIGENYTLDLNVSATFTPDAWWYTLYDLKHDIITDYGVSFTPNITFDANRWGNKLSVSANKSITGTVFQKNVTFFVNVPNSAPILDPINSSLYVCEEDRINYEFRGYDIDEDFILLDISPKNPFFLDPNSMEGEEEINSVIISVILTKSYLGGVNVGSKTYLETLSITDGEYADTNQTNITIIEINNNPDMDNIGVQTIWTSGENSTFNYQLEVDDVESGNQNSGNLTFDLTFIGEPNLFNINNTGYMNYTADVSDLGVHNLTLCTTDIGLTNTHENISLCNQDGSAITECQNFSLTVTNANRPPTIIDYYPEELYFGNKGTNEIYFNITKYDPDYTIPDAYWYVDNSLKEYDTGNSSDEFRYTFSCGVEGNHTVRVDITDGELTDSLEWVVGVTVTACIDNPPPVGDSGGGGGGGSPGCEEKWACGFWQVCQDLNTSLNLGILSGKDYRDVVNNCSLKYLFGIDCGIHTRTCVDINNCSTTYKKPNEMESCQYVFNPGCNDGIQNCHGGLCELLVDCGGACPACPTCSDKIQNQGEDGIDCGGPCPFRCIVEEPYKLDIKLWQVLIILILLILIIIIVLKIRQISKIKEEFKNQY
ncbi:MAG TPA: hypothetical protein VJB35_01050 [Candidatus Nanoarchaeia archaeon]|nr:hypothetical protein [Candidatus Nanoarchaeia archaeon]